MLLLDSDPGLCCLHHSSAVQRSEAESMIDVITTPIHCPAILLVVRDTSRLHDDILNIPPRQVTTISTNTQTDLWIDGWTEKTVKENFRSYIILPHPVDR